jgi:hypothetical protein
MMPVIRISDAAFADLATMGAWFKTKSAADTLERVVREMMDNLGLARNEEPEEAEPSAVTFTKVLSASIGDKAIPDPSWINVLLASIAELQKTGLKGEALVRELKISTRADRHTKNGFKYYSELGISIQGQSARDIWREVRRLAEKYGFGVMLQLRWDDNPKAQYPGLVRDVVAGPRHMIFSRPSGSKTGA